jgi:abortive infection bacteriophage resistance protein
LAKQKLAIWKARWHYISNALATPLLGKPSDAPIWRVLFFLKKTHILQRLKYVKPALTFDQQLSLLESRGLVVQDRSLAIRWLGRVSYYRFSAYLYTYRVPGSNNYRPGTTFSEIAKLYNFDRQLRLMLLDAIERIEIWLRTAVTYELAHRCGPFGYLKRSSFIKGFGYKQFRRTLQQAQDRSKEAFVQHYWSKYTGENHLPIWMATEVLTLGTLSMLFSALPLDSKRNIAATVGLKDNVLSNWLQSIAYIRNLCAHHSRVWNRKLAISPKILRGSDSHGTEPSKLYAALLALDFLISQIAPNGSWRQRTAEFFRQNAAVDVRQMGFPVGWEGRLPFGIPQAKS